MSVKPVEMHDFLWLGEMSGTARGGPGVIAEAGKVYPSPEGHRLFYGTYGTDVVFFMLKPNAGFEHMYGKFFTQNKTWFEEDIGRFGHYGELKLNATKKVIEGWLDLFMGVAAVAGGPTAAAIAGMNALVTAGNVKRDWDKYKRAVEVILYNRDFVKNNCKTLYNVVWVELLLGQLEKSLSGKAKSALADAIPGPKVAGKIAGVFIGKFGEDELKTRLKQVNELFKEVLIKVADHSAAKWPEKLSADQIHGLSHHHVTKILNKNGYVSYVGQEIGELIVKETSEACLGIKRPLKDVSAALDLL